MYTYLLASPNGPDGSDWRTMGGSIAHIFHVEHYARLESKASGALRIRLVEAEASIRHERHRVAQKEKMRHWATLLSWGGYIRFPSRCNVIELPNFFHINTTPITSPINICAPPFLYYLR